MSANIQAMEVNTPGILPDLREGDTLILLSDYSGEHNDADYRVISYLLADSSGLDHWEASRQEIRTRILRDNRRMAYKALNDRRRRAALVPLLNAANTIRGIVFCVAIDKRLDTMFDSASLDSAFAIRTLRESWRPRSWEKMLRVAHLGSFLVAGLSKQGQNLLWITDDDEIAPNPERLCEVTAYIGRISEHYLPHSMGHMRFGTLGTCDTKRQFEDLAAVPDLAGGALSDAISALKPFESRMAKDIVVPMFGRTPTKSALIMTWMSDVTQPLKRLVCAIGPSERATFQSIWLRFHDLRDVADRMGRLWIPPKWKR